MASNFRRNETLKHNPKNLPRFNFSFLLHMTPTPSTAQKKGTWWSSPLILLHHSKQSSERQYFLANVRSWVFKCLSKKRAVHPPTGRTDTGMCTVGALSILTKLGCEKYFCRVTYSAARGCSDLPCNIPGNMCQVACSLLDARHPEHGFCLPSALLEKACGSY